MSDMGYRIENCIAGIRNYGYRVTAQPVDGQEQEYYEHLSVALEKIDSTADCLRKKFHYRGYSKRLISSLHEWLPEPGWGIRA